MKKYKQCLICKKDFLKPSKESFKQFELRKHCSVKCQAKARKGKPFSGKSFDFKGFKHTEKTKQKYRENHLGSKSPFWKNGAMKNYKENTQIRKSNEYKLWRKAVFERDNYTCIWCGARNGKAIPLY